MIKFGTSGWRGVIARDFNFENLRQAARGVADHLLSKGSPKGVFVGYDTRFMSDIFAKEVAIVLASKGIRSYLSKRDAPTPVISAYIINKGLSGGINITASHNPYQYNGFKFSPAWGGPALPDDTKALESLINGYDKPFIPTFSSLDETIGHGLCSMTDPRGTYFSLLKRNLRLKKTARSKIKIYYDAIFGTGRGYLDDFVRMQGLDIEVINDRQDPYFGGGGPEPSDENLTELKRLVKKSKGIAIGVATDGDADRFGIIGSDGRFIEPNKILALIADHLISTRKYPSGMGLARSFATGSLIDLVAAKYGLKIYENPVGFKYIGKLIADGKVILGGEESAGLSILHHVPEKDGILASLLMVEMVLEKEAATEELLGDLYRRVGRVETKRENFHVSEEIKSGLNARLGSIRTDFMGYPLERVKKMDGTKIILKDRSWLLFRESGTEPVVRLYGEARDTDTLDEIMYKARIFLFDGKGDIA